jgi:ubiquitin-conjugating enzyme E2 Z
MSKLTISKESITRLLQDVKNILKNPESLNDNGIYYLHDDVDILKGYALIVGTENTPYFGGYYFFEFNYPSDYPYSPPKVIFKTNGDNIRFNPNLYATGKVCISILNTWRGDQWSSCQTISSVLLTLCTLFCNLPLLNEPGVEMTHTDLHKYTKIIQYKNIEIAILKNIQRQPNIYPFYSHHEDLEEVTNLEHKQNDVDGRSSSSKLFFNSKDEYFYPIMKKHFLKNYLKILDFIQSNLNNSPHTEKVSTSVYNMNVSISYSKLHKIMESCINCEPSI